jgi:hypothetical protein
MEDPMKRLIALVLLVAVSSGVLAQREGMSLRDFEQALPGTWYDWNRLGDFSVANLPNHITLPTVVPSGCLSVVPSRFEPPPPDYAGYYQDIKSIPDLEGELVDLRIQFWRQGCHEPDRSAIMMHIELLNEDAAPLLVRPHVEIRHGGSPQHARTWFSEFSLQSSGELAYLNGIGLANSAVQVGGELIQTGTTYVLDAFQHEISPEAYNEPVTIMVDFGGLNRFSYPLGQYVPMIDAPQLPDAALHGRYSGQWVVDDLPRTGLVLQIGEVGLLRNFVFAIWFTYLDGEPIWVVGNADIPLGDGEVVMNMLRLEGGGFFTEPGSFEAEDVTSEVLGTMTLRAVHCNEIEAEIDFSRSGLGEQELVFSRLIDIAGYTCDQTQ